MMQEVIVLAVVKATGCTFSVLIKLRLLSWFLRGLIEGIKWMRVGLGLSSCVLVFWC